MGDGNPYFYLEYDTRDMQSLGSDFCKTASGLIGAVFP